MQTPNSIFITGASSGIGAALARHYARPGRHLALSGRNAAQLMEAAADCVKRGAPPPLVIAADVTDRDAMTAALARADHAAPLDLVIANAGVSFNYNDLAGLPAVTDQTFAVNVNGVFNTVHPAMLAMRPRRRGQIAIVSSLAGYRGLPSSPAYSSSKVAVKAYGAALRGLLAAEGIDVNVVCPGFIRTPMTDRNRFPMPFLMDVDDAAGRIARGLARNQAVISFPWPLAWAVRALTSLPEPVLDRLLRVLPRK